MRTPIVFRANLWLLAALAGLTLTTLPAALRADDTQLLPLPVSIAHVRRRSWPLPAAGSLLAVAAALLLFVRDTRGPALVSGATQPAAANHTKGGELAVQLWREHDGSVVPDATTFSPGDRFEVRVSCAPDDTPHWDLVVFQGGEKFFPLQPVARLHCANHVTLPGAFSLTGTDSARVCVVLNADDSIDRTRLSQALPATSRCVTLQPAR